MGFSSIAVKGNSANREDQFRLVQAAVDAFGRVDVFVNNAGVESVEPFLEIQEDEIDRVLGINIKGVIFGTQAAAEQMKKQDGVGKIINACSIAGHESYEMLSHTAPANTQCALLRIPLPKSWRNMIFASMHIALVLLIRQCGSVLMRHLSNIKDMSQSRLGMNLLMVF